MNQQSQTTSSVSPADLPMKRKRGRPRKDESLIQGNNTPVIPGSDSVRKNKESLGTSDGVNDDMVGQVVSGVIEGSFDAGYLLNVKVGDTDTHLRGVVFLPGRFTPITAANDVAPHVKMCKRKEIPIPVLNRQTQLQNSVPPSRKSSKQPTELKIHAQPTLPDQVLSSELQISIPVAHEDQSASVMVPLAANLPKNDAGLSLGGKVMPQQTLDPGLESQSASMMAQPEHDKVVERKEVLQECEASTLIKGSNRDVEVTTESTAESPSEPVVDIFPGIEIITKEPQIQPQDVSLDLKPNELDQDEVKNPNLELNQTPIFAELEPMSSEPISNPADVLMENQASPKKDIPEDPQSELPTEILSGADTSLLNGRPASDAVNATELGSDSTQTSQPTMMFDGEIIPSELKLASERLPASDAVNATELGSNSTQTSLPTMMFDGEVIPSELKHASEGSVLPGMIEPQNHSTSGTTNNIECGIKDAIPSTQS